MAKFYIKFPKTRKVYEYEVDMTKVESIEDIAEQIAEQMYEQYAEKPLFFKKGLDKRRKVDKEKFIEVNKRWLIAHLYASLLEIIVEGEKI